MLIKKNTLSKVTCNTSMKLIQHYNYIYTRWDRWQTFTNTLAEFSDLKHQNQIKPYSKQLIKSLKISFCNNQKPSLHSKLKHNIYLSSTSSNIVSIAPSSNMQHNYIYVTFCPADWPNRSYLLLIVLTLWSRLRPLVSRLVPNHLAVLKLKPNCI